MTPRYVVTVTPSEFTARSLRRPVETVSGAQAYLSGLLGELLKWPLAKEESRTAAAWLWHEMPAALSADAKSSKHELPDGSTISVERVEDAGEGR